ncbi:MAG TPA: protein-disulfide reductase DsbD domain-containing protein [Pyrinomonadaceae bacterium]|nr:protein-disulfide reductase DsbD domain-containing protein [Pyrinomonadaceae bacterium]
MKYFLITGLLLITILFAACETTPKTAQNTSSTSKQSFPEVSTETSKPKVNPAETVQFSADKIEVKAGAAGEAMLKIRIISPYHINANPPSDKNLIPTEIEFESKNGITADKPVYPTGETKTFAFSPDKPLSVYEGEIEIKMPIRVAAGAAKGIQSVPGKLKFQPCDNEVCYRPQTIDVLLQVAVS